ncbi:MAG: hypothetical protein JO121_27500 [Deltaproteobacteria bacterium]|nr:hypothetical protein [Deltaproteobacteria bacterium]
MAESLSTAGRTENMSAWHTDAEVAATPEIGLNLTDQLLESTVAKMWLNCGGNEVLYRLISATVY